MVWLQSTKIVWTFQQGLSKYSSCMYKLLHLSCYLVSNLVSLFSWKKRKEQHTLLLSSFIVIIAAVTAVHGGRMENKIKKTKFWSLSSCCCSMVTPLHFSINCGIKFLCMLSCWSRNPVHIIFLVLKIGQFSHQLF